MNPQDNAKLFQIVGRALYPERRHWKTELSFDLDLSRDTVRNLARGHSDIEKTPGIIDDMIALCEERARQAMQAMIYLRSIKKTIAKPEKPAII